MVRLVGDDRLCDCSDAAGFVSVATWKRKSERKKAVPGILRGGVLSDLVVTGKSAARRERRLDWTAGGAVDVGQRNFYFLLAGNAAAAQVAFLCAGCVRDGLFHIRLSGYAVVEPTGRKRGKNYPNSAAGDPCACDGF